MAEGVFMYLDGKDVRSLVLMLQEKFRALSGLRSGKLPLAQALFRKILDYKSQKQAHLGKNAMFRRHPQWPGDGTMA